MSHEIIRTEDNSQDTCVNCGQVGTFTEKCPQPKPVEEKKPKKKFFERD